ncbi:MAG TPA: class I lanthipeptide [Candidatus Dormibacteraeota bacterium]|jgi:hypothetical protein|nr:class I lanthipeptide [Candidatus Dormibacteraeota bacterium]
MNEKKGVKRLALNRETVRELQRDELRNVAGGAASILQCFGTIPPTMCECTGNYTAVHCATN